MIKDEEKPISESQYRRLSAQGRVDYMLRVIFPDWMAHNEGLSQNVRLLTSSQIRVLSEAARKNFERGVMTSSEKTNKSEVLRGLSNALFDMNQLVRLELIDPESTWTPTTVKDKEKNLFYRKKEVRNAFTVQEVCALIQALSNMFGDEYAIPVADAIRSGLQEREEYEQRMRKESGVANEVDVPIIRRRRA
jgi:hypothetical protein